MVVEEGKADFDPVRHVEPVGGHVVVGEDGVQPEVEELPGRFAPGDGGGIPATAVVVR